MRPWKILTKLLLITILALSASGVVNAKVASGLQNLGPGLHQGQSVVNPLIHLAKIDFSTTLTPGSSVVTNSGAKWNNGWRTADGKFASPNGPGTAGAAAEQKVWDAVKQKPGWSVIEGRVSVRNSDGQLRVYDGAAVSPRGRTIGLEVKSGSATKTAPQRNFDSGVNTYNPAVGVGNSSGVSVGRSLEIRVP
ncbi:hypothetical protein [uncultured Marinobacter sp.]|uniref:hypothetical protein n=1 Tax=uncultured Marinobacter sp. TaxID=187379 RepID=UPI0030D7BCA5|tara:strand:+ start:2932 stop:3510 length:579 start_codon:yes stop_codon:yes gene_type:complete